MMCAHTIVRWAVAALGWVGTSIVWAQSEVAPSAVVTQAMTAADAIEDQVIRWRRHIHQHPELAYQETETARYVSAALSRMPGLEVNTGIAGTGIKAVLRGAKPGPVVALRADMDALPVEERNDLPFRSTTKANWRGVLSPVAHACGHDAHVAMLLGAAAALSSVRAELQGTVVFLFQPAEEIGPGPQPSGARAMVQAGVLDNPKVDVVMGQHIGSRAPSGSIGYRRGAIMASGDSFTIQLTGQGGHGAFPWRALSPLTAAAETVLALQSVVSQRIDPLDGPTVVTIGQLQSGNKGNILPEKAEISGTVRSLSSKNQQVAHAQIRRIAEGVASSAGVQAQVDIQGGYDVVVSDPAATADITRALDLAAGPGRARETQPVMASEDFGAFGDGGLPIVFWQLNASPLPDRDGPPNHSPEFRINEAALRVGVRALVGSTLAWLERRSHTH